MKKINEGENNSNSNDYYNNHSNSSFNNNQRQDEHHNRGESDNRNYSDSNKFRNNQGGNYQGGNHHQGGNYQSSNHHYGGNRGGYQGGGNNRNDGRNNFPNNQLVPGQKISLYANLLNIAFRPKNSTTNRVHLYSISFLPSIEPNTSKYNHALKGLRNKILEDFKIYRIHGMNLFSPMVIQNNSIEYSLEIEVKEKSPSSDEKSVSSGSDSKIKKISKENIKMIISKTKLSVDLNSFGDNPNSEEFEGMKKKDYYATLKGFLETLIKSILFSNKNVIKFRNGAFFDRLRENRLSEHLNGKYNFFTFSKCLSTSRFFNCCSSYRKWSFFESRNKE